MGPQSASGLALPLHRDLHRNAVGPIEGIRVGRSLQGSEACVRLIHFRTPCAVSECRRDSPRQCGIGSRLLAGPPSDLATGTSGCRLKKVLSLLAMPREHQGGDPAGAWPEESRASGWGAPGTATDSHSWSTDTSQTSDQSRDPRGHSWGRSFDQLRASTVLFRLRPPDKVGGTRRRVLAPGIASELADRLFAGDRGQGAIEAEGH